MIAFGYTKSTGRSKIRFPEEDLETAGQTGMIFEQAAWRTMVGSSASNAHEEKHVYFGRGRTHLVLLPASRSLGLLSIARRKGLLRR
jgi:hypothetical protein